MNLLFVWMFIVLVPFGLLLEFQKLGPGLVWMTIPCGVIVAWVFHMMDKIGESSENPFEGGPNDVPISAPGPVTGSRAALRRADECAG